MASNVQGGQCELRVVPPIKVSGDVLRGADKIAEFLFGDPKQRRKVYYLAEIGRLPTFRLGGLCARKTTLLAYIEEQERAALRLPNEEAA